MKKNINDLVFEGLQIRYNAARTRPVPIVEKKPLSPTDVKSEALKVAGAVGGVATLAYGAKKLGEHLTGNTY